MSTLVILALIYGFWTPVAQIKVDSCALGAQIAAMQWVALHPEHDGQMLKLWCEPGEPV